MSKKSKRIRVAVTKEDPSDKVGVIFMQSDDDHGSDDDDSNSNSDDESDKESCIVVHKITSTSLFAGTRLKVGMQLLSINDEPVDGLSLSKIMKLLREAEDVVCIEAQERSVVEKNTKNTSSTSTSNHASGSIQGVVEVEHPNDPPNMATAAAAAANSIGDLEKSNSFASSITHSIIPMDSSSAGNEVNLAIENSKCHLETPNTELLPESSGKEKGEMRPEQSKEEDVTESPTEPSNRQEIEVQPNPKNGAYEMEFSREAVIEVPKENQNFVEDSLRLQPEDSMEVHGYIAHHHHHHQSTKDPPTAAEMRASEEQDPDDDDDEKQGEEERMEEMQQSDRKGHFREENNLLQNGPQTHDKNPARHDDGGESFVPRQKADPEEEEMDNNYQEDGTDNNGPVVANGIVHSTDPHPKEEEVADPVDQEDKQEISCINIIDVDEWISQHPAIDEEELNLGLAGKEPQVDNDYGEFGQSDDFFDALAGISVPEQFEKSGNSAPSRVECEAGSESDIGHIQGEDLGDWNNKQEYFLDRPPMKVERIGSTSDRPPVKVERIGSIIESVSNQENEDTLPYEQTAAPISIPDSHFEMLDHHPNPPAANLEVPQDQPAGQPVPAFLRYIESRPESVTRLYMAAIEHMHETDENSSEDRKHAARSVESVESAAYANDTVTSMNSDESSSTEDRKFAARSVESVDSEPCSEISSFDDVTGTEKPEAMLAALHGLEVALNDLQVSSIENTGPRAISSGQEGDLRDAVNESLSEILQEPAAHDESEDVVVEEAHGSGQELDQAPISVPDAQDNLYEAHQEPPAPAPKYYIPVLSNRTSSSTPKRRAADPEELDNEEPRYRNEEPTLIVLPGEDPFRPRHSSLPDPAGYSGVRELQDVRATPVYETPAHAPEQAKRLSNSGSKFKVDPSTIVWEESSGESHDDSPKESWHGNTRPQPKMWGGPTQDVSIISDANGSLINEDLRMHHDANAVTVTACKPEPDSPLGIGLKQRVGGGILIDQIRPGCVLSGTELRAGMHILFINGVDCANVTKEHAVAMLRSTFGKVTIVAEKEQVADKARLVQVPKPVKAPASRNEIIPCKSGGPVVSVVITKAAPNARVGLSIAQQRIDGRSVPIIIGVSDDGICANTPLKSSMAILCIAGVQCYGRDDAIALLQNALGDITIVAGPPHVVSATVDKTGRCTQLGIALKQQAGVGTLIDWISPSGTFADSGLKKGMRILLVNGVNTELALAADILSMISNVRERVTIVAEPMLNGNHNAPQIDKPNSNALGASPIVPKEPSKLATTNTGLAKLGPPPGCPEGGEW